MQEAKEKESSTQSLDETDILLESLYVMEQQIRANIVSLTSTLEQIQTLKKIFKSTQIGINNSGAHGLSFAEEDLEKLKALSRKDLLQMLTSKIAEVNNQKLMTTIQNEVERSKRKLSAQSFPASTEVSKIVFTGGPCAGKTTAMTKVSQELREKGFTVFTIPESATLIFQSGGELKFDHYTDEMIKKFQYNLLLLQMTLEDVMAAIACSCGGPKVVLLCDRGTMDGSAYMPKKLWGELLNEFDFSLNKLRDSRYDLIVHIASAANGAEEFYSSVNNKARSETLTIARALDRKLLEAWFDHPNFVQINSSPDFEEKINSVLKAVYKFLTIPTNVTFHKKYLVANPEGHLVNFLEKIPELILHRFEITDIVFPKDNESTEISYFRKRVI